jgi:hypothetical protein
VRPRGPRGLILGLIRLRSSKFIAIRINTTVQVTNANGTRRTIIPSPEIGRSVVGPTLRPACESIVDSRRCVMQAKRGHAGRRYSTRHTRAYFELNTRHVELIASRPD